MCVSVCEGLSTMQPRGVCTQNAAVYRSAVRVCLRPPCCPALYSRHRNARGAWTQHTAQGPVSLTRTHTKSRELNTLTHQRTCLQYCIHHKPFSFRQLPRCGHQNSNEGLISTVHVCVFAVCVYVVILATWKSTPCWLVFSSRWESIPQPCRLWRAFYHAPCCKIPHPPSPIPESVLSLPGWAATDSP